MLGTLALLVAIVGVRLAQERPLPPAPHTSEELGPLPAPGGPWDTLVREEARLRVTLGPDTLRDRLAPDQPDAALVLDRDAVALELAEVDLAELDRLIPILEQLYGAGPIVDGCADPLAGCSGLTTLRAQHHAELVVLVRWLAGDDEGARALLAGALVANAGLTRTGRTVITQLVGVSALTRAVNLAVALAQAGLVLGPVVEGALASVAREEPDLGRGWIGEVLLAERTLHTVGSGSVAERLFFDRTEAARQVYATQEACIAYARDPGAPRPAPVAAPTGPSHWVLSETTSLAFMEAMLVDCADPIDRGRGRLETARRRAASLAR